MPDGIKASDRELRELSPMPFMAMVASVGSNDSADMYEYLGGVGNSKHNDDLDVAFKQEKSNFHIAIVVDMWIAFYNERRPHRALNMLTPAEKEREFANMPK